ncbi:FRIGIDA-like protein 4a [Eucalyptus grandis]|uniref:FRIGIDA-like protein 4a n=1 Tax=Eucalyptus grandis TaxID=71139 RepID=UPI00192EE955|nr:FRIGIDA-like protein 4a [Eucalyptus grandis]
MGSIPDPGGEPACQLQPAAASFEDFQKQTSLMTSCTLLWKELSDHFSSLEQNLMKKSEALKQKLRALDDQTKKTLTVLDERETTIDGSVEIVLEKVEKSKEAALGALERGGGRDVEPGSPGGEVDDGEGLLMKLRSFCLRMDSKEFWRFVTGKKKELDLMREKMHLALVDCVDPAKFVLEAISEVFPVDKRGGDRGNDLGWACVLILESLIPVVVDPVIGKSRVLVTPSVKERAKDIAETWKASLEERGGIENVKTPDVHTFLQHLVTFGIVKKADVDFYRKLVVGSAWRKQMPKLAVSLGLGDKMPDIIKELISRGQQLDAVHFTYEVGLVDMFPPVPLLKAFLKDARKAAATMLEDPNNGGRAANLASRKEQSALRAVLKCIEEYKLEAQFPPENLKKRLEQLEKVKIDKKRQPAAVPANKRTRANNGGPMPPAKAGRLANAYVSSFPAAPAYVRSPSHGQYPAGVPTYHSPQPMYGGLSPPTNPYAYSPEAAPPPLSGSYPAPPMNYPPYGGYGNGVAPAYQQAYYR